MIFYANDTEDPEDTILVKRAYCRIVEAHIDYDKEVVVAVVGFWRSLEAIIHKKAPFKKVAVKLEAGHGGCEWPREASPNYETSMQNLIGWVLKASSEFSVVQAKTELP